MLEFIDVCAVRPQSERFYQLVCVRFLVLFYVRSLVVGDTRARIKKRHEQRSAARRRASPSPTSTQVCRRERDATRCIKSDDASGASGRKQNVAAAAATSARRPKPCERAALVGRQRAVSARTRRPPVAVTTTPPPPPPPLPPPPPPLSSCLFSLVRFFARASSRRARAALRQRR